MVSLAVLSRLLSPYEFGVVSIAVLVTQLSLVFSEFGVGPCVVQRQMLSDEFLGTAFRLSCLFGMVVAIGIWITAPTLSSAQYILLDYMMVLLLIFSYRTFKSSLNIYRFIMQGLLYFYPAISHS
ncbi:MAG: hypothetical protein E4H16_03670 [Candidatus Atribacteria bacterium]|nr:MAG: hypothetical protein E4H16_03670 [Candidatus Atribacteria bacterium]